MVIAASRIIRKPSDAGRGHSAIFSSCYSPALCVSSAITSTCAYHFSTVTLVIDPRLLQIVPRPGFGPSQILETLKGSGRPACPDERSLFPTDPFSDERGGTFHGYIGATDDHNGHNGHDDVFPQSTLSSAPGRASARPGATPQIHRPRGPRRDDGFRRPDGDHRARHPEERPRRGHLSLFPSFSAEDRAMLIESVDALKGILEAAITRAVKNKKKPE